MSTSEVSAPKGLQFDESAEQNLVNLEPADEFDPKHKEAVDGLLWLGHLTDSFWIFGHRFTLKTLTRGERLAVTQVAKEYEDTLGAGLALETATVAATLLMVDNRPFNPDLGPDAPATVRIQGNFDIIQYWYDPLIENLWQNYTSLMIRQIQAFNELESK